MAYNTIKIKDACSIMEEMVAAAAITPGFLVEQTSAGTVRKHATADGNAIPMFAVENELEGQDITTDYDTSDQVQVWIAGRGDQVYAYLASGQNVAIGVALVSNGDGYLKAVSDPSSFGNDDPDKIVGYATEAVNATAAAARIVIRVK